MHTCLWRMHTCNILHTCLYTFICYIPAYIHCIGLTCLWRMHTCVYVYSLLFTTGLR